jgi:hypothetical protein
MEDMQEHSMSIPRESLFKVFARRAWIVSVRLLDRLTDVVEADWHIIKREGDLFAGTFIGLIGLLNVQSGKYCDGNASDYLSCTRPTTYYYYNGLEVALIIIGVFLVLLWFFKRNRA